MPLSSEQVYNDLTGDDVKQILATRCYDLLNGVPELRPTLTLPRVRMTLYIKLEVVGRTPPVLELEDDLIVRMRGEGGLQDGPFEAASAANTGTDTSVEKGMEINTNPDFPDYQPPDQVREEHGLPIMTPSRGPLGMEDRPVYREDRVKYAAFITQDYGPARNRTGQEGPVVGGEVIAAKNQGGGGAAPDFNRVNDPEYKDKYDAMDANGQAGGKEDQ